MGEPNQGPKQSKEFTVDFQRSVDKPTFAVGGAWGGPSPDGHSVVAHLYVEHWVLPNYLTYQMEAVEGGHQIALDTEERVSRADVTREVQATLVMTPEVAMVLAKWLAEKAQAAIQQRGGRGQS